MRTVKKLINVPRIITVYQQWNANFNEYMYYQLSQSEYIVYGNQIKYKKEGALKKMLAVCLNFLQKILQKIALSFSETPMGNITVQTTVSFFKSSNDYLVFAECEIPVLGTKIVIMKTITTTPTAPNKYSEA